MKKQLEKLSLNKKILYDLNLGTKKCAENNLWTKRVKTIEKYYKITIRNWEKSKNKYEK